jgi:hypothetical protein
LLEIAQIQAATALLPGKASAEETAAEKSWLHVCSVHEKWVAHTRSQKGGASG